MPIKSQIEPVGGRDIVNTALSQRSHRARHLPVLRGSSQVGTPLPVYLINRDEALFPDPLLAAKLIGWKYPIVGGDSAGLVFLLITPGGLKFAGISHSPLSGLVLVADRKYHTFSNKPEVERPSFDIGHGSIGLIRL